MSGQICPRCRRVCFSQQEFENHECLDMDDLIDAEISVCAQEQEFQRQKNEIEAEWTEQRFEGD